MKHERHTPRAQADEQQQQPLPQNLEGSIKLATILMITFIAEHNLPFMIADHFTNLCKEMFPDSAVAQGLHMKRTKCTEMTHKLGNKIKEDLAAKLRKNKFSVIIDESTDTSKTKCLSVIVKFLDSEDGYIKTRMLSLMDTYGDEREQVGSSSLSIYNMLMETLHENQIPRENFVGFAADGTNSMMGNNNSVASRLLNYFPGITIFKCICHSIHLCCSEAAKELPRSVEDLIRSIYSYFSISAKRTAEFKDYQVLKDLRPHKLLHPCQTRWLSLQSAVDRVLEQWDALMLYFKNLEPIEKLPSIVTLSNIMNDPSIFLYLNFLKDILPTLTQFNLLFQNESPTIHLVHVKVVETYKLILGYFCDKTIIDKSNLASFDPANTTNHVPLNNIYLGSSLYGLLRKPEYFQKSLMVKDVRRRCQQFLIKLCQEIRKRFDIDDPLLRMISFFKPETLLHQRSRIEMPSLYNLVEKLPLLYNIVHIQVLDTEWRLLDSAILPNHMKEKCGIVHFYQKLALIMDELTDEPKFKNLSNFALQLLALPVSNTDSERIFSKINLIKTDIRNKISTDSVEALTIISEAVKEQEACYFFKPSESLMNC